MPQIHPPDSADDTRSTDEQFLDLLLAEEELLRAEFDAIIAAEWSGSPPNLPSRRIAGKPEPRGKRRYRAAGPERLAPEWRPPDGASRQRAPPA